jgi:hypothetical protein
VLAPIFILSSIADFALLRKFKKSSTREVKVLNETKTLRGGLSPVTATGATNTASRASKGSRTSTTGGKVNKQAALDEFSQYQMFLLGVGLISAACILIVGGNGTKYSSTSTRGQISDFLMALNYLIATKLSMVMYKATTWFESLLVPNDIRPIGRCSPTRIIEFCQGILAPASVFGMWGLLFTGNMSRHTMYTIIHVLTASNGLRAVSGFILQSAPTLKRIANIQAAKSQQADTHIQRDAARQQRRNLGQNTAHLISYVVSNLLFAVMQPLLFVLLGSFNSSRQLATHTAVGFSITLLGMIGIMLSVLTVVHETDKRIQIATTALREATGVDESSVLSSNHLSETF